MADRARIKYRLIEHKGLFSQVCALFFGFLTFRIDMTHFTDRIAQVHCRKLIAPHVHRTHVLTSRLIDDRVGGHLFFKCENFQKAGSFKIRGATHALLKKTENESIPAVVTHSSGNFAQALARAAGMIGIPAYIVMPENAPIAKKEATRRYGGIVIECASTLEAREKAANEIVWNKDARLVHPSNDPDVILGQGTACAELLEDYPDLDFVVVPVGGGGLLAGTAVYARGHSETVRVVGAEPAAADDAYRSLKAGKIMYNASADTVADGLRTHLGDQNFPVIQALVNDIITVGEQEIVEAMRFIWERMKIIIEPSSAVAVAAVFADHARFKDAKTGIILSGGNVDLSSLPF